MKIKKVTWRYGNDFCAIYECQHCEHTEEGDGYSDANFYGNVIPKLKCSSCGKTAEHASVPPTPEVPMA
tara:strand:- start:141 stop:347 length:207 start_codon:yes stop_codon:yes gene_type:complete